MFDHSVCDIEGALYCAGIFKQSMGTRIRVGIGLSYRPARLHMLAELIPWNRFVGSLAYPLKAYPLKWELQIRRNLYASV